MSVLHWINLRTTAFGVARTDSRYGCDGGLGRGRGHAATLVLVLLPFNIRVGFISSAKKGWLCSTGICTGIGTGTVNMRLIEIVIAIIVILVIFAIWLFHGGAVAMGSVCSSNRNHGVGVD